MNVIRTMLKISVCFGHAGLMLLIKPYAIRNPANVNASEMMKIHIMNLLQLVPNGDFPPPQSEASIRCCSAAKLESIQIFSVTVVALYEGVNELQGRVFPSSERRGGCANQENAAKPPYEGADGVVSPG